MNPVRDGRFVSILKFNLTGSMEGFYEYRSEAKFNSPKSLGFRIKDVKDATSQKSHAFWGKVQHLTLSTFLPRRQPLARLQPNERMIGYDRTWWSKDIITIAIRKESPFSSVFFHVVPFYPSFTVSPSRCEEMIQLGSCLSGSPTRPVNDAPLELQAELEPLERPGLPEGVEWTPGWVRCHQVTVSRSIYTYFYLYKWISMI